MRLREDTELEPAVGQQGLVAGHYRDSTRENRGDQRTCWLESAHELYHQIEVISGHEASGVLSQQSHREVRCRRPGLAGIGHRHANHLEPGTGPTGEVSRTGWVKQELYQ